jgi:hypothetical protein
MAKAAAERFRERRDRQGVSGAGQRHMAFNQRVIDRRCTNATWTTANGAREGGA